MYKHNYYFMGKFDYVMEDMSIDCLEKSLTFASTCWLKVIHPHIFVQASHHSAIKVLKGSNG